MTWFKKLKAPVFGAVVMLLLLAASGCATTAESNDSDIPWNTPQSWEGAPNIPGLNGQ